MRIEQSDAEQRFWWRWTSGCLIGWFLGFLVGFIVAGSLEGVMAIGPVQGALGYLWLGIFVGSGVGLMQWRLLRQRLSGVGSWVVASAAGMGIAGGVGYSAAVLIFGYSEGLEELGSAAAVSGWTVVAACGGAIAGLLQRLVLTRHGEEAGHWILASTLGWALSFAACGTIVAVSFRIFELAVPALGAISLLAGLLAGGMVLGAVTASNAGKLLGKRQAKSYDDPAHV